MQKLSRPLLQFKTAILYALDKDPASKEYAYLTKLLPLASTTLLHFEKELNIIQNTFDDIFEMNSQTQHTVDKFLTELNNISSWLKLQIAQSVRFHRIYNRLTLELLPDNDALTFILDTLRLILALQVQLDLNIELTT